VCDLVPPDDAHSLNPSTITSPRSRASITIIDVAREAGVSVRTVSRVLNGAVYVSLKNRQAVQAVIDRMKFVPSASARGLPGARSYTIGLVFEKLCATYMLEIHLAAAEACRRHGYRLTIEQLSTEALSSVEAAKAAVANLGIDGAIVLAPSCDNLVLLEALEANQIAYTRISPAAELGRSPAVTMDEISATQAMVRHLVELGHSHIGFIVGNMVHGSAHQRLEAFWAAVADLSLDREKIQVAQGSYSYDSGLAAAHSLLIRPQRPTAIFASNDTMAAGVIAAAAMQGLVTPRDLSVCGFDDAPVSRHIWPTLTTIRQPLAEMARAAAEQLLDPRSHPRLMAFDFELVERASTTVPPVP
jgi:LacI family transcriptional regulator